MVELPEAVLLAGQLNEVLGGKRVRRVVAGQTPHKFAFYAGEPSGYNRLLAGRVLEDARPVGGYIHMQAGDTVLLLGEGPGLRYAAPCEAPPNKHQLFVEMEDGGVLTARVAMYAVLWVFAQGSHDSPYFRAAREKPSPLTKAFNETYFAKLLAGCKPSLSIKAFLATEQRVPGLGNGVLQDILLRAGIHPKRKIETLGDEERQGLYQSVKNTLAEMTAAGGRDTEKDLFGKAGGYQTMLSAKTVAYPCLQCGGPLEKQAYMGGSVYFCPQCQPLAR